MFRLRGSLFFKQQKCDFLLLLVDTHEEQHLQYCNTAVHYVNSGKIWGCPPPPQLETWGGGGQGQIQELKGEGPKLNICSVKILPFAIPTLV